jgi:hypothetical protein
MLVTGDRQCHHPLRVGGALSEKGKNAFTTAPIGRLELWNRIILFF